MKTVQASIVTPFLSTIVRDESSSHQWNWKVMEEHDSVTKFGWLGKKNNHSFKSEQFLKTSKVT